MAIVYPSGSAGGTLTAVTASTPLASSGGTTPDISLTGIVPIANGGTGSAVQNFVDLTTAQSIDGVKTFIANLNVNKTANSQTGININNLNAGGTATKGAITINADTAGTGASGKLSVLGDSVTPTGVYTSGQTFIEHTRGVGGLLLLSVVAAPIIFAVGNATEVGRFTSDHLFFQIPVANAIDTNAAGSLKLGNNSNATSVVFAKSQNAATPLNINNATVGTAAEAAFRLTNDVGQLAQLRLLSSGFTPAGQLVASMLVLSSSGAGGILVRSTAATPVIFGVNSVEVGRFKSDGTALQLPTTVALDTSAVGALLFGNNGNATSITFQKDQNASTPFRITNANNGAAATAELDLFNDAAHAVGFYVLGTGYTPNGALASDTGGVYNAGAAALILNSINATPIKFATTNVVRCTIAANTGQFYPATDAGVAQTAAGILGGTGAPNNANGNNGDIYFRSDGGALTTIYQRRAGAWVGII